MSGIGGCLNNYQMKKIKRVKMQTNCKFGFIIEF